MIRLCGHQALRCALPRLVHHQDEPGAEQNESGQSQDSAVDKAAADYPGQHSRNDNQTATHEPHPHFCARTLSLKEHESPLGCLGRLAGSLGPKSIDHRPSHLQSEQPACAFRTRSAIGSAARLLAYGGKVDQLLAAVLAHDAHTALRDAAPLDLAPVAQPVAEQAASLRRQP